MMIVGFLLGKDESGEADSYWKITNNYLPQFNLF